MKRGIFIVIILSLCVTMAPNVWAQAHSDPSGSSNVGLLMLYEKDSNFKVVKGGGMGRLKFDNSAMTFNYKFNGHDLQADTEYCLIYYADPWPGDGHDHSTGALIGSGLSDADGVLGIKGSIELHSDFPNPKDANWPYGAKIWLVPCSDYDATNHRMTAWNPSTYLFESKLITYDDTGVPPPAQ